MTDLTDAEIEDLLSEVEWAARQAAEKGIDLYDVETAAREGHSFGRYWKAKKDAEEVSIVG